MRMTAENLRELSMKPSAVAQIAKTIQRKNISKRMDMFMDKQR